MTPWVVRLKHGNALCRGLFTRGDAPWHLWEAEPALYIRSPHTLGDVVRQLRKSTKVQTDTGRWSFLRFWEIYQFHVLANRRARLAHLERLFATVFEGMTLLAPRAAPT